MIANKHYPPHLSDMDEAQIYGLFSASDMAGEYLDALGKTDLATLSEIEWQTLLRVIVLSYHDAIVPLTQNPDFGVDGILFGL